jgi:hypothetical protein
MIDKLALNKAYDALIRSSNARLVFKGTWSPLTAYEQANWEEREKIAKLLLGA